MDSTPSHLPVGFEFGGIVCGIKPSGKPDLALITCLQPAVAAGVYTQNVVRAASIDWNRAVTPSSSFRAILINSGNANACTGQRGRDDNQRMAGLVAGQLGCQDVDVAVLSTGVIGHHLPMPEIESGVESVYGSTTSEVSGFLAAAEAILTTDQGVKVAFGECELGGETVRVAGMAKGAGMIGPNMATLLAVVCTDANLSPELAQQMVQQAADLSFNRISVEGHTSTNDALVLVSSGCRGPLLDIHKSGQAADTLQQVLNQVCIEMAKKIPADGEGATHLMNVSVHGAISDSDADCIARTVCASNLVKTAITGADPNWGRIVSAAGYSGVAIDLPATRLEINGTVVFDQGEPVPFDAEEASRRMQDSFETEIQLTVGNGCGRGQHWSSDLTIQYVRFNSEYTT